MTQPTTTRTLRQGIDKKKDEVYCELRSAIIRGALPPGAILNETELAKQYNISRTPVREALLMLVMEKLLHSLPRAGYVVTEITIKDIHDTFHLREILESEAARLAAERATPAELAALDIKKVGLADGSNPVYNRDFHLLIAQASGNERLAQLVGQLLDEMERILAYDPHLSNPFDNDEHETIMEALRGRDPIAAQEAMRAHIRAVRTRILQRF